jgi:hypothetical protein
MWLPGERNAEGVQRGLEGRLATAATFHQARCTDEAQAARDSKRVTCAHGKNCPAIESGTEGHQHAHLGEEFTEFAPNKRPWRGAPKVRRAKTVDSCEADRTIDADEGLICRCLNAPFHSDGTDRTD